MTETDGGFGEQIADSVESFLLALRAIAREGNGSQAVSLLLLEISQVLLAGARMGAQNDFTPREEFQPDVGPEADIDDLRLRLAEMLEGVDDYSFVFDPYIPEVVVSRLSDDLASHRHRPRERPAPLPRGQRRRGPVVVAVLLRQQLGQPGRCGAQRAADRRRARPFRHRLRGRRRRRGRRG